MPYLRRTKKPKKVQRVKKTYKSADVKTIVQRTINRNIETKIATYFVNGLRLYNISNDLASFRTNNYFYLSPTASGNGRGCIIAQGTGQGNRVGNEIKVVRAKTSITLYPYSVSYSTTQGEPLDIMMYIVRFRNERGITPIQTIVEGAFFQDGNNDIGLVGDLQDTVMACNNDIIVQSKRIIGKLGPSGYGAISAGQFLNNDYKYNLHYEIDTTKYLRKGYDFNDAENDPYNGATLLIFSPVPPQNATEGSTHQTCYLTMRHQIYYKDA